MKSTTWLVSMDLDFFGINSVEIISSTQLPVTTTLQTINRHIIAWLNQHQTPLTQELERKRQVSEPLKLMCINKTDIYDLLNIIYYITTDAKNLMIDGMPLSVLMGDYDVPDDAPPSVWIPLSEWEDFKAGDIMFVGGDFDVTVGDEGYEIHEEGENFDQDRFADDGSTHEQLFSKGQAVKVKGMNGKYWFACNNKTHAKVLNNEGVDFIYNLNHVTASAV